MKCVTKRAKDRELYLAKRVDKLQQRADSVRKYVLHLLDGLQDDIQILVHTC